MNRRIMLLALMVAALPRIGSACSGPGVQDRMRANELYGSVHAAIVASMLLVSALFSLKYRQGWWAASTVAFFLAIHPRWTVSAARGDCGSTLAQGALIITLIAATIVALQLWSVWKGPKPTTTRR